MADVAVTATSVVPASDTLYADGILGATVTAGQTVYLDSATNTYKLADADLSSAAAATAGIAMNGGATGQPVKVAVGGSINPGFTVGIGSIYIQSATAGGIAPVADLASGGYPVIVGIGTTASNLKLSMFKGGVAKP